MTCNDLNTALDDLLDGALDAAEAARLEQHIASCDACCRIVTDEKRLRGALHAYGAASVPQPVDGFFDRTLLRAAHEGSSKQRNRWIMTGFGGAVAAGLMLWLIGGMLLHSPDLPDATIPQITMALEAPRTVNLVFSSADDLRDATLTVHLPAGLELAGFQGKNEVTWITSLSKGRNLLPLKLIATTPQGGELLAILRHGTDDRTFRVQVTVI